MEYRISGFLNSPTSAALYNDSNNKREERDIEEIMKRARYFHQCLDIIRSANRAPAMNDCLTVLHYYFEHFDSRTCRLTDNKSQEVRNKLEIIIQLIVYD